MPPPPNPPHASTLPWQRQGPLPSTDGEVEKITDREVVGAIQAIAPHPANPDILYIAAVNGGIWRTDNALAARPQWTPLADEIVFARTIVETVATVVYLSGASSWTTVTLPSLPAGM